MAVTIFGVEGIGEVRPGDDVAALLLRALERHGPALADGDIVVVTHKIVSKAEGRIEELADDSPDAHRRIVEREAATILRRRGALSITKTRHGFICANAGVDRSNAGPGRAILLPLDPDASAHRIRLRLQRATGRVLAVVVTDTFGRPWRRGLTDVAIGVSGMEPIQDLRGTTDTHGRILDVTEVAVADEVAAAADLVMGKARGIPAAVVRGFRFQAGDGRAADLIRPAADDLFR